MCVKESPSLTPFQLLDSFPKSTRNEADTIRTFQAPIECAQPENLAHPGSEWTDGKLSNLVTKMPIRHDLEFAMSSKKMRERWKIQGPNNERNTPLVLETHPQDEKQGQKTLEICQCCLQKRKKEKGKWSSEKKKKKRK